MPAIIQGTIYSGVPIRGAFGNYLSDVLRDLVPFVQFKKCEKHPWTSFTFRSFSL